MDASCWVDFMMRVKFPGRQDMLKIVMSKEDHHVVLVCIQGSQQSMMGWGEERREMCGGEKEEEKEKVEKENKRHETKTRDLQCCDFRIFHSN